jgi:predicted secreted protein
MANSLSVVIPRLLAMGLLALRENALMARIVNRGYEDMAGKQGSTIDVPIPSAIAAADVVPAAVPPDTAAISPTQVSIVLDQWKEAAFELTDKEQMEVMNGTIPMQASEAIKALINTVDRYILALGEGFFGYVGTAGTTPFASDTTDVTNARKVLSKQLAPLDPRHIVMDPDAEGNALNLRAFQDASWVGSVDTIVQGKLNQRIGFNFWMSQNVQSHTAGTITTGLISKAGTTQAVGLKTVVCTTAASTGACALKLGDIITFAGDRQTYVVTEDATQAVAATDVNVKIEPGLKVAHTGSEAVSVKATHVMNLAFHRDAIAFANRPLEGSADGLGSIIQSASDAVSGLTLRLEVSREHKRTRFSYDMLYGGKVVRRELGCRIAG